MKRKRTQPLLSKRTRVFDAQAFLDSAGLAKKIVEGRPYRNKRDLVTRQLLTKEQYDKVKDLIVAKRSPQK